ncbi:hypothetical protein LY625_03945 [Lysobacter sp. GX 14042]|uniref:hypothetical protein n=1 Tax=Lysobacter sp. GX 14042 TaxID=2907155 RepID=UPI001F3DA762|nr:hypothetical protein [Lysobacter sp. GX 14042]MCE7031775.1 hypothetical protein [Lysobacter sp. GX 14042]
MTLIDPTLAGTWPGRVVDMAIEAMRKERVHGSKARRLCDLGIAVMMGDRCVLTIPARDALLRMMRNGGVASKPEPKGGAGK